VDNPNHKGNVAELAIATEAARLGLSVLKPLTEHERYDLALGLGGVGRCRTSRRGYVRATYLAGEIDALGVYCQDLDRCYLLPASMVVGRHALNLRVSPARNNQHAAVNFAADYELGAVAQLEERRPGRAEVRGSSPLSSTPKPELRGAVGMDELYAKLAQYARRAEAG
jgi:hypothetical protein